MIDYYFITLTLLIQGSQINSEIILNISAVVGETAELACNAELRHRHNPELKLSWYQCQNINNCSQLIGTVTPALKCVSRKLSRFNLHSEDNSTYMIISDLQQEDAGFYNCVITIHNQILANQKVYLQIKQGQNDSQLVATTADTTNTKESTKPSSSVAETSLTSIAVAVWLCVIAVMFFLCLYGRHLYLKARLPAPVRRPDVFQITTACGETSAGPFMTDHTLQRNRRDCGPQIEAKTYESLSRSTRDIYSNLDFGKEEDE